SASSTAGRPAPSMTRLPGPSSVRARSSKQTRTAMDAPLTATARAYRNIALIKYWGNRDAGLRLPANGSVSMNLAGLETGTTVQSAPGLRADELSLDGQPAAGAALERVSRHLALLRALAGVNLRARVTSRNTFPTGTGIASSASAFSALTVAAAAALGLALG